MYIKFHCTNPDGSFAGSSLYHPRDLNEEALKLMMKNVKFLFPDCAIKAELLTEEQRRAVLEQ